ncbi:MAG TPA: hypothetical protein VJ960_00680 [Oceanipulchritudo sp.]|nr:hypothetical protein [Oceanipulchritudo sp.]
MKSSDMPPDGKQPPLPKWEAVERQLYEERKNTLSGIDTATIVKEFDLAFQTAFSAQSFSRTTGLIDQQACFSSLRKPARRKP